MSTEFTHHRQDIEDEELLAAGDRWLEHRRRCHDAERELARWTREHEAIASRANS